MENKEVIDKSKQHFMSVPQFSKIFLEQPLKLDPIDIQPLRPIAVDPGIGLSAEILKRLGVKEQVSSFFNLLGCSQCSACKAMSKQTLNEIGVDDITQDG